MPFFLGAVSCRVYVRSVERIFNVQCKTTWVCWLMSNGKLAAIAEAAALSAEWTSRSGKCGPETVWRCIEWFRCVFLTGIRPGSNGQTAQCGIVSIRMSTRFLTHSGGCRREGPQLRFFSFQTCPELISFFFGG